ncbi:MAG: DNA polymerase/3'-5' exonuclease PolX [Candidatus Spechtbacterales bacterium]
MTLETNKEIAHIFEEMALLYEIKNDRFRQRALHRGAQTISDLAQDLKLIYKENGLKGLDALAGIGKGMSEKIEEYIKTGHVKEYEKLKKEMPANLEELTSVEGLGPKTAKKLYEELNIKTLKDLEDAVKKGKLSKVEGLGKKTEENIAQGIEFVKSSGGRIPLGGILPYSRELIEEIKEIKGVIEVSEAGSLRRRQETIGDVDILVAVRSAGSGQASDSKKVLDYAANLPSVVKVWGRGKTKISVHLKRGFDIDIRVVSKESYGAALQYFTGSKDHNVKLRKIAISKKYKLNEYGLFKGRENVAPGTDECLIYKKLGMECMPPELRTDSGEIELAQKKKLPNLIKYGEIKGDLQVQTNWTDGKDSIEEMAKVAKDEGLEYIAITDHTKNLAMTNGLNGEKILKQKAEIKKLNKKLKGITILAGTECDILKDGSLDIEDKVLKQLDVVGVSVHSHFNLSRKEQTERIIKAMNNPNVDMLFHPTGRRINIRPPYDVDMEAIIREAKRTGTILEINGSPERLDLRDEYILMAVKIGAKMCINTDAHAKEHFKFLEYGIAQARRGWAKKSDIINTLPLNKFLRMLKYK